MKLDNLLNIIIPLDLGLGKNKTESLEKSGDSVSVPRTGIEPVRPLLATGF